LNDNFGIVKHNTWYDVTGVFDSLNSIIEKRPSFNKKGTHYYYCLYRIKDFPRALGKPGKDTGNWEFISVVDMLVPCFNGHGPHNNTN
jgi:hypothetical protein